MRRHNKNIIIGYPQIARFLFVCHLELAKDDRQKKEWPNCSALSGYPYYPFFAHSGFVGRMFLTTTKYLKKPGRISGGGKAFQQTQYVIHLKDLPQSKGAHSWQIK